MDDDRDVKDGKAWSDTDIEELRIAVEADCSIEHAAAFIGRATNVAKVEQKARDLGLPVRHE